MKNITQIQELLAQQVAVRTDELLTEATPKVVAATRVEIMDLVDTLIETRVTERLAEMRPATEQQARNALLRELAASSTVTVTVPTRKLLTPAMAHDILTKVLDPITAARGIKKAGAKWACAFCGTKYATQRAATMHSRKCSKRADILAASRQHATAMEPLEKRRHSTTTNKPVKRECIKPGCAELSKGPRYHYLCDDHKKAPPRHVKAWQRKVRETHAE